MPQRIVEFTVLYLIIVHDIILMNLRTISCCESFNFIYLLSFSGTHISISAPRYLFCQCLQLNTLEFSFWNARRDCCAFLTYLISTLEVEVAIDLYWPFMWTCRGCQIAGIQMKYNQRRQTLILRIAEEILKLPNPL